MYCRNNPVSNIDGNGQDFSASVQDNTININATITIYGKDANNEVTNKYQN